MIDWIRMCDCMDDKIKDAVVECFEKLGEQGIYFQSGTLVFNNIPLPCQDLQILVNHMGDVDE